MGMVLSLIKSIITMYILLSLILIYMKAILHCRQPIIDTILLIILKPSIIIQKKRQVYLFYIFYNNTALVDYAS